jgi:hypothetical protein
MRVESSRSRGTLRLVAPAQSPRQCACRSDSRHRTRATSGWLRAPGRVIGLGQEPGDIDRFFLARDQRFALFRQAPSIGFPVTASISPFQNDEETCIDSRPENSLDVHLITATSDAATDAAPVALASTARRRKNALYSFGCDSSASTPLAAVVGQGDRTTRGESRPIPRAMREVELEPRRQNWASGPIEPPGFSRQAGA